MFKENILKKSRISLLPIPEEMETWSKQYTLPMVPIPIKPFKFL
jgi:hypothetical protein